MLAVLAHNHTRLVALSHMYILFSEIITPVGWLSKQDLAGPTLRPFWPFAISTNFYRIIEPVESVEDYENDQFFGDFSSSIRIHHKKPDISYKC